MINLHGVLPTACPALAATVWTQYGVIFGVKMIFKGFNNCFSDERLDKRCSLIIRDLFSKGVHSIRQLSNSSSDAKGFYRFLQNERTEEQILVNDMAERCAASCKGKTVLCIQDSSEINMYNHKNRLKKDGYVGTTNAPEGGLGYFIHPSLVVDAQSCIPYGFSHIKIWSRPEVKLTKFERKYNSLPIEEKESYKWIETANKTKEVLSEAASVIIIQDREGDIYEQFASVANEKTDLLIRARTNRTLKDGSKLFSTFDDQPAQCVYTITIEGDKRKNRKKRAATIEVRYKAIEILRTDACAKSMAKSTKLYLIEAKEVATKVSNPVCWRLLTTLPIEDNAMALTCIEWYSWRWMIEEVFRILKKEGFDIEASELEYEKSIRKLCLLMLDTIIKLFMMHIAYSIPEEDGLPPDSCFTAEEQQCLELVTETMEGKTEKQKNKYKATSLKRYVWPIARLGGWKGYSSERPPGITTLWMGIQKFNGIKKGWLLKRNVSTR